MYFLFVCPQISIKMSSVMKFSCVLIVFALLVSMSATNPYCGSLNGAGRIVVCDCNQASDCADNDICYFLYGGAKVGGYKGMCGR